MNPPVCSCLTGESWTSAGGYRSRCGSCGRWEDPTRRYGRGREHRGIRKSPDADAAFVASHEWTRDPSEVRFCRACGPGKCDRVRAGIDRLFDDPGSWARSMLRGGTWRNLSSPMTPRSPTIWSSRSTDGHLHRRGLRDRLDHDVGASPPATADLCTSMSATSPAAGSFRHYAWIDTVELRTPERSNCMRSAHRCRQRVRARSTAGAGRAHRRSHVTPRPATRVWPTRAGRTPSAGPGRRSDRRGRTKPDPTARLHPTGPDQAAAHAGAGAWSLINR